MLGKPHRDVFAERRQKREPPVMSPPAAVAPRPRVVRSIVTTGSALVCCGLTVAFLCMILITPTPVVPSAGKVFVDRDPLSYGFGREKALLVFNLTAYAGRTFGDERGLEGLRDIHPDTERMASLTMYRDGTVYKDIHHVPIAVDQKGGDRPQLNLGFEFRDKEDPSEDDKYAMLGSTDDAYEDYFIRGCYLDPSCTRDLAPTVLDVTPQMRGETVEVLFWEKTSGYTYEGVYLLLVKLKRAFYEDAVPWSSKGKKSDAPCSDSFRSLGVVYESEKSRPDRSNYSEFEMQVLADAKYPKSKYWEEVKAACSAETYQTAVDYYSAPNLANTSVIPLDLHSFVQMYLAAQLMMQVDFGFEGAQQYYYKSPGNVQLSTGPPYDFDSPWDLCKRPTASWPDVVTCHGERPSPLWEALGKDELFLALLRSPIAAEILRRDRMAIDRLYAQRVEEAERGYFDAHEARWPVQGRTPTLYTHLLSIERRSVGPPRDTILDELRYQRDAYLQRAAVMNATLATIRHFSIRISHNKYIETTIASFWWYFTLAPIALVACAVATLL